MARQNVFRLYVEQRGQPGVEVLNEFCGRAFNVVAVAHSEQLTKRGRIEAMHFGLRTLFVLVTLVAVDCFLWTITPPLVRIPATVATIFVLPGFAFMVLSYLKDRRGR